MNPKDPSRLPSSSAASRESHSAQGRAAAQEHLGASRPAPLQRDKAGKTRLRLDTLLGHDPAPTASGGWQRYCCPLGDCAAKDVNDEHRSLAYNPATGGFHCHRCGAHGLVVSEGGGAVVDPVAVEAAARRASGAESDKPDKERVALANRVYWDQCVELDQSPLASAYLASRGIDPVLAAACEVRANEYQDRVAVAFPLVDRTDGTMSVNMRYADGADPRQKTLGEKKFGLFTTLVDWLDLDLVIVTEAPIDALSLRTAGYEALALCGVSWPDWLPGALKGKRLVLAFDADGAGEGASASLLEAAPTVRSAIRLVPPGGLKDWNDALRAKDADALARYLRRAIGRQQRVSELDSFDVLPWVLERRDQRELSDQDQETMRSLAWHHTVPLPPWAFSGGEPDWILEWKRVWENRT